LSALAKKGTFFQPVCYKSLDVPFHDANGDRAACATKVALQSTQLVGLRGPGMRSFCLGLITKFDMIELVGKELVFFPVNSLPKENYQVGPMCSSRALYNSSTCPRQLSNPMLCSYYVAHNRDEYRLRILV
jgi:hypothetical protein